MVTTNTLLANKTPFQLGGNNTPTSPGVITNSDSSIPAPDGVWMPVDLPSMGLARYPAQIRVKKFGLPDLVRLGAANKASSYAQLVAAIGATIQGVDVRMLTHGDFDYLMYWHAVNSITKTPLIVTWQSRYGFENSTKVDKSLRTTISIDNADAVMEMQAKGYDFSRVGDELWRVHMEDANASNDSLEVEYALATWVWVDDPTNFDSKLAAIRADDTNLDFYEGLDEWRKVANHGVLDVAKLTCQHFKPEEAIERVVQELSRMDMASLTSEHTSEITKQTSSLLTELAELRKLEAAGRLSEAKPIEEEVRIPLDVTNFFPVALRVRRY